ncbi:hypothetical protein PS647_02476 [Pseudomonas fluorescens]|jgi:pimeloyl-ACP methyl ester carboxylesterase|uniref:lipase family alpha/beta hydrolase n=1 Tax=Pseudomonas fluorescens TaxID=294 RepID=UPI001240A639|nr:alpha/beta fold hydrolase [Pseudomonas fluorescens]VVM84132.1 hypothetical protein PS647_02476 [Pseudomonas fluorescens]
MRWFALLLMILAMSLGVAHADASVVKNVDVERGEKGSVLVVMLHGYTLNRESLRSVQSTIKSAGGFQGADFLIPNLPFDTFSMATPTSIVSEVVLAIDKAWNDRAKGGNPYSRVVLVGHSIGGLYARLIYVAASGENAGVPFNSDLKKKLGTQERPWARQVDRIVLLAGMNRGWTISHHMSFSRAVFMKLGSGIGHVAGWVYGRPPVIFTIRRGSSLITDLRLQWLEMRAQARVKKAGGAIVVQLLGTVDDLVSPEDNLDLEVGKDFFYIEVPRSGHRSVIAMDQKNDEDGGAAFRQRALLEALGNLSGRTQAVSPVETSMQERDEVTDVVFIIHGIRDEGYWAEKIAYRVKLAGQSQGRVVAAVTSTYGYFPMLSFLTPGARQEKVEWLMDRYTEARAKYPNAERFHYIGHSHGTYLLAKALQDYPSVRFDNVVFAGSVVRQEYEWNKLVPERVKSVHNFVATSDWVVAFFPKALQSLDIQDLGSAGHDGFTTATELGPIQELPETYIIGGHSSALQEALWDGMAVYTMTGKFQLPQGAEIVEKEQSWWVVWPGKVAPVLWLIIASAVVLGFRIILKMRIREWKKTLAIVVYCMVLWTILTEV